MLLLLQGIGLEQIHLHLSQGYIVKLTDTHPGFTFTQGVVEVILVFGIVYVEATGEIIEAPHLLLPEFEEVATWCLKTFCL